MEPKYITYIHTRATARTLDVPRDILVYIELIRPILRDRLYRKF
jgi:hypothetical protein